MKKYLILFISIINIAFAQKLSFDTKFYDAEDKWVVFDKKDKQNTYALGFIYFDPQFGYTFDYAGELEFKNNKFERLPRLDTTTIKNRLDINTFPVAILPDEKVKEFKLDPQPEWLKNYKLENSDFIENRIRRASLMNGAGASEKALKILQQAYIEDPHYPGLEFELGYAYNAIGSFYKAVIVLNKAIENDPINFWYYRELGFSLKHLNNLPEAEKAYRKAISLTADKDHIAEVAINMAQSYFHTKDKVNFDAWRKIVVENAEPDSQFMAYIQYFDENWHKPK
ncbi:MULTISPECIES: hypothetical protein [Sphingobacterium]|jgi:tetratricopeptide (TPR) repeat protein|uniref:hypothetical protein n=1 Tax=Sphingobacterium TaxID=28453 RepID=UPI000C0C025F|nr:MULTISPECIES: hypothetical protein [Sphingobacterium]VTP98600.1 Predicted O-linked N-acetylglucosamine transferase, SPINDLY family [Sphingobacterium daejeonense]